MDFSSYITGFVDGEGCFCISFSLRAKMKYGLEVRPSFSISQNQRNLEILKSIYNHFGCGGMRFSRNDNNYKYEVRSIKDIVNVINKHFDTYPLKTSKKRDFEIFSEICTIIHSNHHLNVDGMKKIIELAYQMNESGKRKYKKDKLLKLLTR